MYEPQAVGHCAVSTDDIQPFKFQGQMFDSESNLHYNRFRYYDYDVGMFIQRDPIGLLGGNNVFAYAPNPIGWIDPLGLNNDTAWAISDMGQSAGWQGQLTNTTAASQTQAQKPPTPPIKNKTVMTNLGIGVDAVAGGSFSLGSGQSYDSKGKKSQCYSGNVCVTAGAEAKAAGSWGGSITNASTDKGWSHGDSKCLSAVAGAPIGVNVQGCRNSDGGNTGAVNAVVGAGLGASASYCYAVTYCQ